MICVPIAGGNWNNGSNAGLSALNLNNSRSNSNSNIGFRPALDNACCCAPKGDSQSLFQKDATASALAETTPQPVDASAGCIYQALFQFDHLLKAAYDCRKGKSHKAVTLKFFDNLEENLINLQNHLIWQSYEPGDHYQFYVFEPKRRLISAPNFTDRVLHRAIYNLLYPLFDKQFIYDSYACRIGKGAHKGADRAQRYIRSVTATHGKAFALKADIAKYFSSINHTVLKRLLRQKIRCSRMVSLLSLIIDKSPDTPNCGIPLGNLTSQLFANVYLHELDVFVKQHLKIKRYARYMDDFAVIHHDKVQLHQWRRDIEHFLQTQLGLKTNRKTQVFPVSKRNGRSLDFLGYRIYADKRLLRRCSVKRIKTALKKLHKSYAANETGIAEIKQVVDSWLAHAMHASTTGLINHILSKPFVRS